MSRDFTCSNRIFKKMTFRSVGTPKSCTATTEVFAEDRLLGSSEEEEKKNNNFNFKNQDWNGRGDIRTCTGQIHSPLPPSQLLLLISYLTD